MKLIELRGEEFNSRQYSGTTIKWNGTLTEKRFGHTLRMLNKYWRILKASYLGKNNYIFESLINYITLKKNICQILH